MIYAGAILMLLAGASKGLCDRINFHERTLPGWMQTSYFLMSQSWKRKYKNNDPEQGEWFPGSTTIFVALTDAWHLGQLIYKLSLLIGAILLYQGLLGLVPYPTIISLISALTIVPIGFHITYK